MVHFDFKTSRFNTKKIELDPFSSQINLFRKKTLIFFDIFLIFFIHRLLPF